MGCLPAAYRRINMARLNRKFIEQLQNTAATTDKEIICFDDDLQGFGISFRLVCRAKIPL
jgi:hypothetical protein